MITPLPWHCCVHDKRVHWINDQNNMPIAEFNFVGDGNQVDNANYIVNCANSHDELVKALNYAHETMLECVKIGISLKDNSLGLAITGIEQALTNATHAEGK